MQLQAEMRQDLIHILTNVPVLYKNLDFDGAIKMIRNHNIKFANVATLNDPFDCYRGLIDMRGGPNNLTNADYDEHKFEQTHKELFKHTGIASFSDSYKNLFLWGNYNSHQGICIGLDTQRLLDYILESDKQICLIKVKYVEEFEKINFWQARKKESGINIFSEHLTRIKSTVWEKENEIRLVYEGPSPISSPEKSVDFPHFMEIPPECFVSIHMGCNLQNNDTLTVMERVIILLGLAWRINPEMKVYEMLLNSNRFALEREEITKESFYQEAKKGFDIMSEQIKRNK